MQPPLQRSMPILHPSDVAEARRTIKTMATAIGFDEIASEEIALAASELAMNLVRHAIQGTLTMRPVLDGAQPGIEIESSDRGPGIKDIEEAMADGFSTAGSLGYGLGTVNRLMADFHIASEPGKGTHVLCRRWIRADESNTLPCPLDFGAATRPHPRMEVNGDTFIIKRRNKSILVGVIDGLGHGQFANRAAQTARRYVESHFDHPLAEIFRNVGRGCRSTRGVVMALARFDFGLSIADFGASETQLSNSRLTDCQSPIPNPQSAIRLTFASIGNIEVRVFNSPEPVKYVIRRGIIGLNAPNPVVTEHRWDKKGVMVLHSDGLRIHWRWEDFPDLAKDSATVAAQRLLRALARDEDDATVVVVKGRTNGR